MAEASVIAAQEADRNVVEESQQDTASEISHSSSSRRSKKKRARKMDELEQKLDSKWNDKFNNLDDKLNTILNKLGNGPAVPVQSEDTRSHISDSESENGRSAARVTSDRQSTYGGADEMDPGLQDEDTLSLMIQRNERDTFADDGDDDVSVSRRSGSVDTSSSSDEGRFKNCRLTDRNALFQMFGKDALPIKQSGKGTGLVPDKTQEDIIKQSWRLQEPSKLTVYKLETHNSFKIDKEYEELLSVPSLDSIIDPLLKHKYGSKASFKNGHSLYSTTYKNIEKEAYKGQCAARMSMMISMYVQQGLGTLLTMLQQKDLNLDLAIQSTKDIFAMASQNLDQAARAGAYHHLVRRKATVADTGLDKKIPDFDRWELPLSGDGVLGKDFEKKMKLRKEENKNIQDLFSDDEKNKQSTSSSSNKRKSNYNDYSSNKRTRYESPKRKFNDRRDSSGQYQGGYRNQYRGGRGQSSSRQGSFRGGRRGGRQ